MEEEEEEEGGGGAERTIGVPDGGDELHLGRAVRVRLREDQFTVEDTALTVEERREGVRLRENTDQGTVLRERRQGGAGMCTRVCRIRGGDEVVLRGWWERGFVWSRQG